MSDETKTKLVAYTGLPAPEQPRTRPAGFEMRPVFFDDARVREALSPLDVALLELLVAYQRAHGRPSECGSVGGVTVPLSTIVSDGHVRAKVRRLACELSELTPRRVRASLEKLRRYGFERVVCRRYVAPFKDATSTVRVQVREALPGVEVPDDSPRVFVPFSEHAHEQAERDLAARANHGGRRWGGQSRTARGTFAPHVAAVAAPSNAALATVKFGSSSPSSEVVTNQRRASGAPSSLAPYTEKTYQVSLSPKTERAREARINSFEVERAGATCDNFCGPACTCERTTADPENESSPTSESVECATYPRVHGGASRGQVIGACSPDSVAGGTRGERDTPPPPPAADSLTRPNGEDGTERRPPPRKRVLPQRRARAMPSHWHHGQRIGTRRPPCVPARAHFPFNDSPQRRRLARFPGKS